MTKDEWDAIRRGMLHTEGFSDEDIEIKMNDTSEYRDEVKAQQLIDHIASGDPDRFTVFAPSGSRGVFDTYQEALEVFHRITQKGYSRIILATRIGTAVELLSKEIK